MKAAFKVEVLGFKVLKEVEGVWSGADYTALLDAMEFGDLAGLSEEELREMCVMSLQDLEPEAAALLVLKQHLGDRLTAGQMQNLSCEMLDEKAWEEFADMGLHEGLFNVGSLLYAAFPREFPEPDAVRVKLEVEATNDAGREVLATPLHESFIVRLLSDGMETKALLHRMFEPQLTGKSFPEAEMIVWTVEVSPADNGKTEIEVISSGYWLDSLRGTESYESAAYADVARS